MRSEPPPAFVRHRKLTEDQSHPASPTKSGRVLWSILADLGVHGLLTCDWFSTLPTLLHIIHHGLHLSILHGLGEMGLELSDDLRILPQLRGLHLLHMLIQVGRNVLHHGRFHVIPRRPDRQLLL